MTSAVHWLHRQRLERQLHDGASLRISALSLRIGLCCGERRAELQDELHAVLQELREVANQLYPPLLDEAGLGPALRELASQRGAELSVETKGERFGAAAEGAAYFGIAECLDSAPDNGPIRVTAYREGGQLILRLEGLAAQHARVMLDQAGPLGGEVDFAARTGTITVRTPCE